MSVGKRETDDWIKDRRATLETGPEMRVSKRNSVLNGYRICEMETIRTAGEMRCRQAENARLVKGKWIKYLTVVNKTVNNQAEK